MVEKEEWQAWLESPQTKEYLKRLKDEMLKIQLENGAGSGLNTESVENTALNYSRSVGRSGGLQRAIEIVQELKEENKGG